MNWEQLQLRLSARSAQAEASRQRIEQALTADDARRREWGSAQKKRGNGLILLFALLLLGIDNAISPYISFPFAFLLPIGITVWWAGRAASIALAVGMVFARIAYTWPVGLHSAQQATYSLLNALVIAALLILVAALLDYMQTHRLYTSLDVRQLPLGQSHQVLKILRGLLPICAYCKRIRDQENEWQQLEDYITLHSEAQFSHSICPDCKELHFGAYAPRPK